jgi:protein-tyrosine phosphatase
MKKTKILFVCLGNICRSPAAEGVMKKISSGLPIEIDSAGTAGYHAGQLPDSRMRSHAKKRGYILDSRARQFEGLPDFKKFDYIIPMDRSNMRDIQSLDPQKEFHQKIHLMTDFCTTMNVNEVPDPYYEGPEGFEHVLDILEDACNGLLNTVQKTS